MKIAKEIQQQQNVGKKLEYQKKEYISLEVDLLYLDAQDIVTASNDENDIFGDDIFDD